MRRRGLRFSPAAPGAPPELPSHLPRRRRPRCAFGPRARGRGTGAGGSGDGQQPSPPSGQPRRGKGGGSVAGAATGGAARARPGAPRRLRSAAAPLSIHLDDISIHPITHCQYILLNFNTSDTSFNTASIQQTVHPAMIQYTSVHPPVHRMIHPGMIQYTPVHLSIHPAMKTIHQIHLQYTSIHLVSFQYIRCIGGCIGCINIQYILHSISIHHPKI